MAHMTLSGGSSLQVPTASDAYGNQQLTAPPTGVGATATVPTGGTNTTPVAIGTPPEGAVGVRMYAPSGGAIPFCVAASASAAASAFAAGAFKTYAQSVDGSNWDENIAGGMNLYVGVLTGLPTTPSATAATASFRYY